MTRFYGPGTSFGRYLQQELDKAKESSKNKIANHVGIFQDIEAEGKEIEYELIEQRIREQTGIIKLPDLKYKGMIDGRITRPYPGPAKEGSFWVVAFPGYIGSHTMEKGDILVRLSQFDSDWLLISDRQHKEVATKPLKVLSTPKTKAAPGPQKRKVILEDE